MRHFCKNILFIVIHVLLAPCLQGQAYLPNLTCFDKNDYNAGRQNWDIDIDKNGVVYFGNTNGLLYNVYGEWGMALMSEKGNVRSVYAENDTIWCGGSEYGYFTRVNGELKFTSLGFTDGGQIWNIEAIENTIIFQSENEIIQYKKGTKAIHVEKYPDRIWTILKWQGKIWLTLRNGQIGYLDKGTYLMVSQTEQLLNREVRKMFVHNNILYFVMFEGGLYQFDGEMLKEVTLPGQLKKSTLFTGISYNNDSYCLGTISEGFLQLNNKNELQHWVNSEFGLIDNTVLSMKADYLGNIWLGLDYGIAKIELQSAINYIFKGAATYAIQNFNNETFIATNKGLLKTNNHNNFKYVPDLGGQVWMLKVIGHELFICHNRGLFLVDKKELKQIVRSEGFVDVAKFEGTKYYLFSTYNGLFLVKRQVDEFSYIEKINIEGHPKILYDGENKCIWAEVNNEHVCKLTLGPNNVVIKENFPEIRKIFHTRNGFYFSGNKDILQYTNGRFYKSVSLQNFDIDGSKVQALDISPDKSIVAFIQDNEVKLEISLPDGNSHSYSSLLKSLGQNINPGDEFISLDNNHLLIATDRGVVDFNIQHKTNFRKFSNPVISSLTILEHKPQKYFFPFPKEGFHLGAGNKDLKFQFGINKSEYDVVEYRYRLTPAKQEWSDWTTDNNEAIFTQVKGGSYIFYVQSRINGGNINETTLTFSIDKLWYQTLWILLPFGFVVFIWVLVIVMIMNRRNRRKLKKQKQHYKKLNDQKSLNLKNEQLLQYIEIISHKNEFLNRLKTGLETMRNTDAQHWVNMIDDEVSNEKKEFLFHKLFSEIHQDFITRLAEKFPTLTANDVRILSFIRINLDNREISNLMNITSRSLDTNRYRIRKKLNLEQNADLNKFIREF